ncbi:MAG: type III polyketide synthase [Gemmatimonadales bacterium]|nr:MAG: type III polyketide synthase [Gemmatimonadales bacterium]
MQEHVAGRPATRRVIRNIYRNSGIEKRHSVIDDWGQAAAADPGTEPPEPLFFAPDHTRLPTPGTGARNAVYAREAPILFERVARELVETTPGFTAADVTHVITISCTGFFAPGPDFHVVRALGLPGTTQRYHIGFMGCYAAFQGLRMADAFCRSDPEAVVLVLSAELCTLHLQFTDDTDDLIAGALFADGAAGALVSARAPVAIADGTAAASAADPPSVSSRARPALEFSGFHSELAPEGEKDMAWTIGDEGFRMKLSTYVPEIIEANLAPIVGAILGRAGLAADQVPWWALHPGGRAIVDRVQGSLSLSDRQVAASRDVLRQYGNMSSATVLFVLKALLDSGTTHPGDPILAMAFGPGLTIETGLFRTHRPPRLP